jgi:hypothetical protein
MPSPLAALGALKDMSDQLVADSKGVAVKRAAIKQYTDSRDGNPTPAPAPKAGKPGKGELVKPGAKFGDRPGEQRIDTDGMTKKLGSFKKGTKKVKKTAVYKLHKGEAVVPAKTAGKMRALFGK